MIRLTRRTAPLLLATLVGLSVAAPAIAQKPTPPLGRYTCLRLGTVVGSDGLVQNTVASDITLLRGGRYTVDGVTGAYTFDPATGNVTWRTGALATAKTDWVGVYAPVSPSATNRVLRIRSRKDIASGNMRDLQWCNAV